MCDLKKKSSIIDNSLECHKGSWFYFGSILTVICLICLLYMCFITILMFYTPNFIIDENDKIKKSNSIPDLILFINKIIFVVVINSIRDSQWFILCILFLCTFINTWSLFYYNYYDNIILRKLSQSLGLILFSCIICLIIGKIFQAWNFNGALHLFLFATLLNVFIFIYHKEKVNKFYNINFKQIDSSEEILKYIKNFLMLIKFKDKNRNNFIIFKTLILLREENCINKNCKLKRYLKFYEKGYKMDFLLYDYCQQLFEIGLKKFPNDIILKANYIIYLVVQMSKRKLAKKIILTMKEEMFFYQNNYIIFCCKKYIESYVPGEKSFLEESNKSIMKTIEYENIYNLFKENISKAASLYYEFWASLYKSHLQGTEDFIKLNNIGDTLNSLIKNIEENYYKLHNVKSDDFRVINLYSGFLKNILNSKIKYNDLKNDFFSLLNEDKIQEKEFDYSNFDLKILNKSDKYKYIVASGEESNLGSILFISLNVCQQFGYRREELMGAKIYSLFPEIYQNIYLKVIMQKIIQIKNQFYEIMAQKKEYKPKYFEMLIDGRNKSKYLIPLYLKTFFAQTEESEHVFVNELLDENIVYLNKFNLLFNIQQLDYINGIESKLYNFCFVLTDFNFNIQTFTANCQNLLGLNSNAINTNIDITNFIEEFNDDVNKMIYEENTNNEYSKYSRKDFNINNYVENFKNNHNSTYKTSANNNTISSEKLILYKRYIAEKKYFKIRYINWKFYDLIQLLLGNKNNHNNISNYSGSFISKKENNKKILFDINEKERTFLLIIQKAFIYDQEVGYKFIFKRQKIKCIEDENEKELISQKNNKYLIFQTETNKARKKNSVSFNSININDNEKTEGTIHNSRTANLKKIKKLSNSLIKKNNIDDLIEKSTEIENSNIANSEKDNNSSILKKNNITKKPSKFYSLKDIYSDKDSINDKTPVIINEDYVPTSSFQFILDLDSMSFKSFKRQIKTEKNLVNMLKNEAMEKLQKYQILKNNLKKKKISFSSYDSSYEESESFEEEESSYIYESTYSKISRIHENKKQDSNLNKSKEKTKENKIGKNIREEIDGHYYRVSGLNKIRYMIYDYDQEMVVDKGYKKDIKSEVENIIINYKLKIPTSINEDRTDPSNKIKKYLSKYSNVQTKKDKSNLDKSTSITNIGLINQKNAYKELEIYKKIENSLNKNDKEKLIIRLYIIVILCTIILLIISGFVIFFIISNINKIKSNILLIIYSVNLRHFTNMGIYYSREITISSWIYYSNDNKPLYYPIYENRNKYLEGEKEKLKEVFSEGHKNMELMMGTNIDLDKNNSYYLNEKPFQTVMRYDISKQRIITSTLSVSIVEIYSFFYHLIITNASQDNWEEVFNFMSNAMNNLLLGIEEVIKIYLSEILIRSKHYFIYSILILVIFSVIYIGIYFIIKITYLKIIYRKESYISTFFEINLSFINSSMIKCEKFINKLNPNEFFMTKEKNEYLDDDSISFSNIGEDLINKVSSGDKTKSINNLNNNIDKKIKFKEVSKNRIFKIKLIGILSFLFIYIFIVMWIFFNLLNKSQIMGLYIYKMQHFHNNILNLFNAYREFIFLNISQMDNTPIYEYLGKAEKELYDTFTSDINFIAESCEKVNGLCKNFREIQQNHLCYQYSGEELSNVKNCDYYMEVITSLGFYNLINFWTEEIRIKKNFILIKDKINNMPSMTFYNVEFFKNRTILLFNDYEIHPDVNYIFTNILLPYISEERQLSINKIIMDINSEYKIYITLIIIYFFIIIILLLFFWRPIIIQIKTLIYKTKNMLSIIPVEILEAQTNIKSLLGTFDLNE